MRDYNPFTREEDIEARERIEARIAHEEWSRQQSLMGRAADQRDNTPELTFMWTQRHD